MKTTIIKAFVVLACMALGIADVAKCQIYSSEACFYASAGSSSVYSIVRFEGSRNLVWVKTCGFSRQKLAENKNYYENEQWYDHKDCVKMYEYDRSMSTSQREVYKYTERVAIRKGMECLNCARYGEYGWGCGAHGYKNGDSYYVAFSKDKSSYISWRVRSYDVDKEPVDKRTYTIIPKENLLPKAANYDFLNE